MSEGKKKAGRPAKTLNDLPEDWQQRIIDLMSEGGSLEEVKVSISLYNCDAWKRFQEKYPIFRDTIKKGLELSEAWWKKQGRINLQNTKFSPTLWYMNMKNRFGWRDNRKVEVQGNLDIRSLLNDDTGTTEEEV